MGKIILLSAKATRGSRNDPVEGCKLVQISFFKEVGKLPIAKAFSLRYLYFDEMCQETLNKTLSACRRRQLMFVD